MNTWLHVRVQKVSPFKGEQPWRTLPRQRFHFGVGSGEERKFFNESFQEVRGLIKKIYSTRSKRELDLIDPTWSPTFIAILLSLSLSLLVPMHDTQK